MRILAQKTSMSTIQLDYRHKDLLHEQKTTQDISQVD